MTKLNVKLLNRIKKHLIAEPKRLNQNTWGESVSGRYAPMCGTQACIAGWAVFLSVPKAEWGEWMKKRAPERVDEIWGIPYRAGQLLGLTEWEKEILFAGVSSSLKSGKRGVRLACKKIDELIESRKP